MNFLYSIIILPIESIIEFVFCFTLNKFEMFGVAGAIIAISLVVNFLALPIYNVADEIQLRERNLQKKMAFRIARIKDTFKGDEQFMMLSEYYRLNNYHPLYTLRQSFSIIIEIPFFIAAYHFLNNCSLLEGQSILFLKDLANPDALVTIRLTGGGMGQFSINILPILMTAINIVSSIIYTQDAPLREKIQTNGLAIVFLVILYNSPSGLVFYWILNNLFSLCKNIVLKTKSPGSIVHKFLSVLFVLLSAYLLLFKLHKFSANKCLLYFFTIVFVLFPFIKKSFAKKTSHLKQLLSKICCSDNQNLALLILSCISLSLLCGVVLPSSVIATSPVEFSFLGTTDSPLSYIWSSFVYFSGLFVFWPVLIYKMFSESKIVKTFLPPMFFVVALCTLVNAFLLKHNYGLISLLFTLSDKDVLKEKTVYFSVLALSCFLAFSIAYILLANKKHFPQILMISIVIAQLAFATGKISTIKKGFMEFASIRNEKNSSDNKNPLLDDNGNIIPQFHLSKTEKNVFVLFWDRAISNFFPYILEEFPNLKTSFDGFSYYPNCLCFGYPTYLSIPAMLGGYEYTATAMNERKDELLKDEHNESLLLMPKLFSDAGFDVTISDLPYPNYKLYFDKNFFEQIKNTRALKLNDKLGDKYLMEYASELTANYDDACRKRIKLFCFMEILFPPLRNFFYNEGDYFYNANNNERKYPKSTLDEYAELFYLPELITFDSKNPTFTILSSGATHFDKTFTLIGKDYHPGVAKKGENETNTGIYNALDLEEIASYQTNASSYLLLEKLIKFLKENDCYDNTRLIIVADHGYSKNFMAFRHFSKKFNNKAFTIGNFNPLLLVKDFNSHGSPVTINDLISNADTPLLVIKNLPVSEINPFTGKKLQSINEQENFSFITVREDRSPVKGNPTWWTNDTQFIDNEHLATLFFSGDNIFEEKNWSVDKK